MRHNPAIFIFRMQKQWVGINKSALLKEWFPLSYWVTLHSFKKFWKAVKSTTKSSKILWNLISEMKYICFNFLKLKSSEDDPIVQLFHRIGFPQEMTLPKLPQPFSLHNLKKFWKAQRNTTKTCQIYVYTILRMT